MRARFVLEPVLKRPMTEAAMNRQPVQNPTLDDTMELESSLNEPEWASNGFAIGANCFRYQPAHLATYPQQPTN